MKVLKKSLIALIVAVFAFFVLSGFTMMPGAILAQAAECEHEFVLDSQVIPTCAHGGYNLYKCTKCNFDRMDSFNALPHDYVEEITKEPTATEMGEKTFTCSACGSSYSEEIPALGMNQNGSKLDSDASLPGWAIALIVILVVAVFGLGAGVAFFYLKSRRKQ